jgi:hypothetical protein
MKTVVTRMDIPRTRASWPDTVFTPAYVISRDSGDKTSWLVANSPVPDDMRAGVDWASAASDEYVRIPLYEYQITHKGDLALAFMFKLGSIATSLAPINVKKLYIVTGTPVELIKDAANNVAAMSYWFGFAIAAEE